MLRSVPREGRMMPSFIDSCCYVFCMFLYIDPHVPSPTHLQPLPSSLLWDENTWSKSHRAVEGQMTLKALQPET